MFENHVEAVILSLEGAGGKRGQIKIGYAPCNEKGETGEDFIPDDFLILESAEELIGKKDMFFQVCVLEAKGLPIQLCRNPFVTYKMHLIKNEEFQT
jgi:hypothetical protein